MAEIVMEAMNLKIGVTLHIREGQQSLWENGIFQNCYFLIEALNRSSIVGSTYIVCGGPGNPKDAGDFLSLSPAPAISMSEAMETLDVIIELSSQLDAQWAREFVAKGKYVIGMHVANDFVIDAERVIFDLAPGFLMAPVPYHEIWTLPAFEKTCGGYYAAGARAPVRVMPHIWSPEILERTVKAMGRSPVRYQPGRNRWRLGILEPNICTVKTCHLPMILSDVAHRTNPKFIEYLRVYNALKIKENTQFVAFARSLDLVDQGLATFEARFPIYELLGEQIDAIISHHWENGQNYLWYEALYAGFPLVHNSRYIGDCGYYYNDYDPEDGALALIQAFECHDRNFDAYKASASRLINKLDPKNDDNVRAFETAILGVIAKGKGA